MYKLSDLRNLEKNCNIHLAMVDFVVDEINEKENTRRRILRDHNGRYFFHSMKDGEVIECFEIMLYWKPISGDLIFAYTPDGRHPYEIDANPKTNLMFFERRAMPMELIQAGDKAVYRGNTVEFINDTSVKVNGNIVPVAECNEYVYSLRKNKINAINGARGLFHFLDGIAEEGKFITYPILSGAFDIIADKYGRSI